tara:strand:- start:1256 stop:1477 length:222 start_codon:yes stop_codon:yes gene_type:complete
MSSSCGVRGAKRSSSERSRRDARSEADQEKTQAKRKRRAGGAQGCGNVAKGHHDPDYTQGSANENRKIAGISH